MSTSTRALSRAAASRAGGAVAERWGTGVIAAANRAMRIPTRERTWHPVRRQAAEKAEAAIFPADAPAMPWTKRVFDVVAASAALVALSPVMAVIALGIKWVDPGPVLFCQERVGLRGRRFRCCKFRSMRMDNCPDEHQQHLSRLIASNAPMTKLDHADDPRIIPLGRLLRASGLDELPQLFSVLRGDMSLVGPRPCIPYEYAEYADAHKQRLLATPGLTGLWQVSGKNRTTFEEMVRLDVEYAHRQSVRLDLWILLRTPAVILGQLIDLKHKASRRNKGHSDVSNGGQS